MRGQRAERAAVIPGVCESLALSLLFQEFNGHRRVATMARLPDQSTEPSEFIDGESDFAGAPTAGAADRLSVGPLFRQRHSGAL